MPTDKTTSAYGTAVQRCVEEIRNAILQGALLPGQHIKQEAIAKDLGVSRIPVRDALGRLAADGVLVHMPNSGYNVARFDLEELDQLYRMRELLETELLLGVAPLPASVLRAIEREHEAVCKAADEGDTNAYHAHNNELHFLFFRVSGKELILREVVRLWQIGEFYRTLHVYDVDSRFRVLDEHEQIVGAARKGSAAAIVEAFNAHRSAAQDKLHSILSASQQFRIGRPSRIQTQASSNNSTTLRNSPANHPNRRKVEDVRSNHH